AACQYAAWCGQDGRSAVQGLPWHVGRNYRSTMSDIQICAAFDSGNIEVASVAGADAVLTIRRDQDSDFFQWFHFRVSGARMRELRLRITGLNAAAYPLGWAGYQA